MSHAPKTNVLNLKPDVSQPEDDVLPSKGKCCNPKPNIAYPQDKCIKSNVLLPEDNDLGSNYNSPKPLDQTFFNI